MVAQPPPPYIPAEPATWYLIRVAEGVLPAFDKFEVIRDYTFRSNFLPVANSTHL